MAFVNNIISFLVIYLINDRSLAVYNGNGFITVCERTTVGPLILTHRREADERYS